MKSAARINRLTYRNRTYNSDFIVTSNVTLYENWMSRKGSFKQRISAWRMVIWHLQNFNEY